jgi:hypothetical protein
MVIYKTSINCFPYFKSVFALFFFLIFSQYPPFISNPKFYLLNKLKGTIHWNRLQIMAAHKVSVDEALFDFSASPQPLDLL